MEPGQAVQPPVRIGQTSPTLDNWALAKTPEQMTDIISGPPGRQPTESPAPQQDGRPVVTTDDYQQQLEQFRQQLEKVRTQAYQLELSLATGQSLPSESSQPPQPVEAVESPAKVQGILPPTPQTPAPDRLSDDPSPGLTATLPDGSELAKPPAAQTSPGPQDSAPTYASDASARIDRIAALFRPQAPSSPGNLAAPQQTHPTASAAKTVNLDRLGAASRSRTPATSPDIEADSGADAQPSHQPISDQAKPKYENLDPATREKFDRYMKEAELYQRQGQYSRAAESFAVASIYAPGEARVYLGRSQALLAAGDYAGSALFLTKAVDLDARQSLAKSDLLALVGGPDQFIQRVTELQQCAQQARDAANLQFLLAYVYQQMDRPAEAKAAIEAAAKAQPRSTAISALQAAIHP
jgi:hypothetical protein